MFKLFRRPEDIVSMPFSPRASAADLAACFRLLLGRAPTKAEWLAHAPAIGGPLRGMIDSFAASAMFVHDGVLAPRYTAEQLTDAPPSAAQARRVTTPEDIYYCFRLLLGRLPNREEITGHWSHIGADLDQVISGYTGSREFALRLAEHRAVEGRIVLSEQDGFRIYIDPADPAVGLHVAGRNYEPDVTRVFRDLLRQGMSVIDIGANIGYFTMLAASLVGPDGRVLALEPNPRNARMLEASRRVNRFAQVTLCQAAAGREAGILVLHTTFSNGTTSAISDDIAQLLESETVACVRPDSLVPTDQRVDFIKVDVEGAEYLALQGCRDILAAHRPIIASEFGPEMISGISGIEGPAYLGWLEGLGYRLSVIQPDGAMLAMAGPDAVMVEYAARQTDHLDIVAHPI